MTPSSEHGRVSGEQGQQWKAVGEEGPNTLSQDTCQSAVPVPSSAPAKSRAQNSGSLWLAGR